MDILKTCAFTGHRQMEDSFDFEYFKKCVAGFIEDGYDTFLCGMAMGFDLVAAELILKLKKKNAGLKLIACIPCPDQERYFSAEEKKKYKRIISKCDEVKLLNDHYYNGCMQMRDRYMVDNCSLVIGYKRRSEGGTYYTLNYAASKNKKVCIV